MAELTRALLALVFTTGIGACGLLTGNQSQGPTVLAPITPAQKATASDANPDSAILADFNARLDRFVTTQRALMKGLPISENATPAQIKARQDTLAAQLRMIRKNARQEDIFTPQVARSSRA